MLTVMGTCLFLSHDKYTMEIEDNNSGENSASGKMGSLCSIFAAFL